MILMLLALLGREVPELPCHVLFNPMECKVLGLLAKKKTAANAHSVKPLSSLSLNWEGKFLDRKCDGVPGFESMWRGYARFCDMVEIIRLARDA